MQSSSQSATDRFAIVVGVDFTAASVYALRVAANLARPAGPLAELHVVHVTPPIYWPALHETDGPMVVSSENPDLVRKQLLDACFSSGHDIVASIIPHARTGDATGEIADLARELDADLIVIGAHKRNGLARALHRSTYARIVRRAPCSVLTALPKEEAEVQIEPPCAACVATRRESDGQMFWCKEHSAHHIHGHLHHGASDPNASGSWDFRA
jgi:universal stress protein A